jgi:hypothetical protein
VANVPNKDHCGTASSEAADKPTDSLELILGWLDANRRRKDMLLL